MEVLAPQVWRERVAAHRRRLAPYVEPHLARRQAGERHPVHDFLFTYYSQRPAQLLRWHPGQGVGLSDAAEYAALRGYRSDGAVVAVDPEYVAARRALVADAHALLTATAARPGSFGCFGLHEWAMVYRAGRAGPAGPSDAVRHPDRRLRLGGEDTDRVVETHRVTCSHFDAYRFFTEPARPLNRLRPGPDDRAGFEQPGCLHTTMDLYKHAYRLAPMTPSDLVADCFELAWQVRDLDMRASPYDLRELGYEPVRIETPDGKAEYAAAQRELSARAVPLRAALADLCERLLALSEPARRGGAART